MKIYIPSRGRPGKVKTPILPTGTYWGDRTFVLVPESEARAYERAYPGYNILAHDADGIVQTRQWAFDHANGEPAFMLDDDVKLFARESTTSTKLRRATEKDIAEMLDTARLFFNNGYAAVGLGLRFMQQQRQPYEYWKKISEVWGVDTAVLAKHNIRYPASLRLMEDYYTILELMTRGYPTVCINQWVQEGETNTEGGCSLYRTPPMQQEAAEFLRNRFPAYVKLTKVYDDPTMKERTWRISWAKIKKDYEFLS